MTVDSNLDIIRVKNAPAGKKSGILRFWSAKKHFLSQKLFFKRVVPVTTAMILLSLRASKRLWDDSNDAFRCDDKTDNTSSVKAPPGVPSEALN